MKKILGALCLAALALLAILPITHADVPTQMSYQGYLTDSEGEPLNEAYNLAFAIYNHETEGERLWSEDHPDVEVRDGLFSVILGSQGEPLDDKVFVSSEAWLEVYVDGRLIEPRTRLTSVGYAQRVSTVDGAGGGVVSGDFRVTGQLAPDNGVVTNGAIRIESIGDSVLIVAGTSKITIDQYGAMTITSTDMVTISSASVEITSETDLTLSANGNMSLEAMNIDIAANATLDMEGSAGTTLSSGAITGITGSLVTIN